MRGYLRDLTRIELVLYKDYYAEHPYLIEKSQRYFPTYNTAFAAAFSDVVLDGFYPNEKESNYKLIIRQGMHNLVPVTFSPLICMLALSSVIGKEIIVVYPEKIGEETKYSWYRNGAIMPRVNHGLLEITYNQHKIVIMWSKSGSLSFLPIVGIGFQPDHFVALANMDLNAPHSGYSLNSKQVTDDLEMQTKRQSGMH